MAREPRPENRELDSEEGGRYRRPRRPVEIRRRARWRAVLHLGWRLLPGLIALAIVGGALVLVYRFAASAEVFRVQDVDGVEVVGTQQVVAAAIQESFTEDVSRTVFAVPLGERRHKLEEISWVEAATVQRLLPNRLRVHVRERTPVAFLRRGHSLWLVDRYGVILSPPEGVSYNFPVLSGLSPSLSVKERQARVEAFLDFMTDLDREGKPHSQEISEVDLSDPENLRASVTEKEGTVYLYFGRGRYQEKFETYVENRSVWRQSGEEVRAVDLRYRGQIVLNPNPAAEKGSQ
jgi:cell division protein FtsQ